MTFLRSSRISQGDLHGASPNNRRIRCPCIPCLVTLGQKPTSILKSPVSQHRAFSLNSAGR
jgi:hypothetical protein